MSENRPNFRLIKERVSMLDVLARYQVELRAKNQWKREGKCPLPQHGNRDGKPSFHIDRKENGTWVWACHETVCVGNRGGKKKGGDLIEFVGFMEKCGLRDAGQFLESWYGPFDDTTAPPPPQKAAVPAAAPRAVNPPLAFQLKDIQHVHPYLAVRGFEEEECEYLGVGFFSGKGMMRNRIVFPLHDALGTLIGYAGRRVEYSLHDGDETHVAPECPNLERWIFPPGFLRGQVVYNLHRVTEDDWTEVIVCESFWGVLACIRAGIMNAVAIMSNYATDAQVKQLLGFRKVVVLFDGDRPGREGAADLVRKLEEGGCESVEQRTLADGVQPDSVSVNSLRVFLGIPKEPDGPLTITDEALSLLEAAPA
jgi:DNA primase